MRAPELRRGRGGWPAIALKKRDPTGTLLWQHLFSQSSNYWTAQGIAVTGAGDIVVAGHNHGGLDFGGGVLPGEGMFLAKLDAAGHHVWSRSIEAGSGASVHVWGIAADAAGGFAVTGTTSAPMDFGGGMVTGTAFLVRFDGSGNQLWTKSFTHLTPTGLAISGAGRIGLSGKLLGPVDLGGGPVDTNGGVQLSASSQARPSTGAQVRSRSTVRAMPSPRGRAGREVAAYPGSGLWPLRSRGSLPRGAHAVHRGPGRRGGARWQSGRSATAPCWLRSAWAGT